MNVYISDLIGCLVCSSLPFIALEVATKSVWRLSRSATLIVPLEPWRCKCLRSVDVVSLQTSIFDVVTLQPPIWRHIITNVYLRTVNLAIVVEGSLFNSSLFNSYGCVGERGTPFPDCPTLLLKRTLFWWVLSKKVSSTIFKVFCMKRPGIEPRYPGPLEEYSIHQTNEPVWLKTVI